MIANLENIQKIYTEIPNTWTLDGFRIDNYSQSNEHFAHGWREVVIPTTTNYQRLGDQFILVNDIVTKEVINFTAEEIEAYEYNLKPKQISRMKFIIQVFITTGIMYEDIVLFIQNLNFDASQKYVILTRLRSATHFDRNSADLLTISQMMGITSQQLDEIFINGNLLD
jgi:hypothetical protein